MVLTKTRYTFADLLDLPSDDYTVYDILGGELVAQSSPVEPHAAVVFELSGFLYEAQRAGLGRARTAPRTVAFDFVEHGLQAEDVTHPDVLFVVEARRAIMGYHCVEAAPDLVVEVLSPSTRADDLPGGRKWNIYERYGVPHYWIVDVDTRTIALYEWRDGRCGQPVVLRPGDVLTSPLLPGHSRAVSDIFDAILE